MIQINPKSGREWPIKNSILKEQELNPGLLNSTQPLEPQSCGELQLENGHLSFVEVLNEDLFDVFV